MKKTDNKEVTQDKINRLEAQLYCEILAFYEDYRNEGEMKISLPAYIYVLIHSVAKFAFDTSPHNLDATVLLVDAFSSAIKNHTICEQCQGDNDEQKTNE